MIRHHHVRVDEDTILGCGRPDRPEEDDVVLGLGNDRSAVVAAPNDVETLSRDERPWRMSHCQLRASIALAIFGLGLDPQNPATFAAPA